jgi:hypothetical protein
MLLGVIVKVYVNVPSVEVVIVFKLSGGSGGTTVVQPATEGVTATGCLRPTVTWALSSPALWSTLTVKVVGLPPMATEVGLNVALVIFSVK